MEKLQPIVAKQAAHLAGKILTKHFADLSNAKVESKNDASGNYDGIVTSADVQAEAVIIETISNAFPGHQFLAEEGFSEIADTVDQIEDLWIIDPLDGTNNFAHGIDHFAVSIAYYRKGVPQFGIVYNPFTGDEYWAEKDQGAHYRRLGGPVLQANVNHHEALNQTMVAVGFYYDRGEMMQATLASVERLFTANIHGIRRMGTAALDIVQVGIGSFGAFFEYQLSPWDFAAARLFLEEAGGTITTCSNEILPIAKTSVLATNGHLHQPMLDLIRR